MKPATNFRLFYLLFFYNEGQPGQGNYLGVVRDFAGSKSARQYGRRFVQKMFKKNTWFIRVVQQNWVCLGHFRLFSVCLMYK